MVHEQGLWCHVKYFLHAVSGAHLERRDADGSSVDLTSTNIIAYLTSSKALGAPRITLDQLQAFLNRLAEDQDGGYGRPRIISSRPEWILYVRNTARDALDSLGAKSSGLRYDDIVPSAVLSEVLEPFITAIGSYHVYRRLVAGETARSRTVSLRRQLGYQGMEYQY